MSAEIARTSLLQQGAEGGQQEAVSDRSFMPNFLGQIARPAVAFGAGLTLAATGAFPATAEATKTDIVIGKGVDGVNIGATPASVMQEVGVPTRKLPPSQGESFWEYPNPLELSVIFRHGRVFSAVTDNPVDRTNKNIGVGSSFAALKQAYPVKCTSGTGPGRDPQSAICTLKSGHGKKATEATFVFATKAAGIEEVAVSLGF